MVGIFVLPNVVQLDHFLHEHKTHEVCESHDWEQHIHSDTDENCSYLHKIVNPDLSLQAFSNQLSKSICKYHIISNRINNTSKHPKSFALLRAPPNPSFYWEAIA